MVLFISCFIIFLSLGTLSLSAFLYRRNKFPKVQVVWLALIGIGIIAIILTIPIFINESYTSEKGYVTYWKPDAVLGFYGSFLTFLGTVTLGIATIYLNNKANKTNERLLNLENVRESKILFEMYFSYVEEFGNIFDPIYVIGKPNDVRNDLDIFSVIKSSQLKALSIRRRLLLIDKDNSSHTYLKYAMDKYDEILSIVIKTDNNSPKDTFKGIMSFIKTYSDENNKKSLEFMYYISKKLFTKEI